MATDRIDHELHASVEHLREAFYEGTAEDGQASIVAGHFLWGPPSRADAIRKSYVDARKAAVETAADEMAHPPILDSKAFDKYVENLDRHNIFLSFLDDAVPPKSDRMILEVAGTAEDDVLIKIEDEDQLLGGVLRRRIVVNQSRDTEELFCPVDVAVEYVNAVYQVEEGETSQELEEHLAVLEQRLWLGRMDAFSKLWSSGNHGLVNELQEMLRIPQEARHLTAEAVFRFLRGLQGALVFLTAADPERWVSNGLPAQFHIYRLGKARQKDGPRMVTVLYPGIDKDAQVEEVQAEMRNCVASVDPLLKTPKDDLNNAKYKLRNTKEQEGQKDIQAKVENAVHGACADVFQLPGQAAAAEKLTMGILCLLEELQGRRHEGQSLEFWFVLGDESQLQDSQAVKVREFKEEGVEVAGKLAMPVTSEPTQNQRKVGLMADALATEHFPWFERSRNALCWDVTAAALAGEAGTKPNGLASMVNSRWELLLEHAFIQQPMETPPLILLYVTRDGETGVAVAESNREGGRRRPRVLVRLKPDGWRVADSGTRKRKLRGFLEALAISPPDDDPLAVENLAAMLFRIAENPNRGGTLVIVGGDERVEFPRMGYPLQVAQTGETPSTEDIEALMSHDGATVLRPGESWEWSYRNLLGSTSSFKADWTEIRERLEDGAGGLLKGAGSRRWSSAFAAFQSGVKAVIVVSQDGGITCWRIPEDGGKGEVLELPVDRRTFEVAV